MLHLLQSIDLEKIVNSGIAIVIVSSFFFWFLSMGKKIKKIEKYDFDEEEIFK